MSLFKKVPLPRDAVDHIVGFLGGVYDWNAAKAYRDELMAERSKFASPDTNSRDSGLSDFWDRYNLCEH